MKVTIPAILRVSLGVDAFITAQLESLILALALAEVGDGLCVDLRPRGTRHLGEVKLGQVVASGQDARPRSVAGGADSPHTVDESRVAAIHRLRASRPTNIMEIASRLKLQIGNEVLAPILGTTSVRGDRSWGVPSDSSHLR